MKILLISGHGAGDSGAIGNGYKEADLTREVVNILKDKLSKYTQVEVYNQNRNAFDDVGNGTLQVNWKNYNYVFEVHFNAGGGKGTEIYVTREEKAKTVEQKIMDKLGQYFTVRGVKEKNFNVIYSAKKSGVSSALLEVCFIDNTNDIQIYQANKDSICQAISEGIAEGFGLSQETKLPDLQYRAHLEDLGWQDVRDASEEAGTTGESRKMEAIYLWGNNGLDLQYRVHIQDIGWQEWKNNGEMAGTTGQNKAIEAIEIKSNKILRAQEHIAEVGWMPKSEGTEIRLGTEGKALRLEAFKITVV